MRAPLSWIREFTPLEADPVAIADALDNLGLEVEAMDAPGREILGVKVAKALDVRKHPDADKVRLVDIDFGDGTTTVVCGAPNVTPGMVVPYAPVGATLPGGFTLTPRKIRGIVSDGMLLSPRELGLGGDHGGLLALDPDAELGADVRDVLELHDVVFDLAITPNRPDAMSIVGVSRDLAAHFGLPFTVPEPVIDESGAPTATEVTVRIDAPDRCPRFTVRRMDVTMGESPAWLARRLTLAGMRPISNVVDVTNYVLLERGQPLHAFDLGRLPGRGLIVRLAGDGERMTTLDGVQRVLSSEDLLVCDADGCPQAIAGIMGGSEAEVHAATSEILLEAAYFQPMGISRSSKRLGLRSESSARFERGIDPNGVLAGSARAAELLRAIASARVAPEPIDRYPVPITPARIHVRVPRVEALLGVELGAERVKDALRPLDIEIEELATGAGQEFVAIAPTFRPDLEREIDIVEEIARRVGFNEIPRTLPHTTGSAGGLTVRQRERRLLEDVLVGVGAAEAMTLPLIAVADLERCGLSTEGTIEATNALRAEEPILRPAILPGLLRAAAFNAGQGFADLALFELGHVFAAPAPGDLLPVERDQLAVLFTGIVARAPIEPDRPVDSYDVVGALDAIAEALEIADLRLVAGPAPGFEGSRSAAITIDGSTIGHAGSLAAAVLEAFGIPGPAVAFELDVDGLFGAARRDRAFRAPSRFPASNIDLAFVLPDTVPAADVERTLRAAAGDLLEAVRCFDEFRSDALGAGRRSLAFALRFRAPDRTLTDTEIGATRQACIDAVVRVHRAELRG
ncbi:MAG: phenylalanine--tRNA ligase subunit beta [Acidimicrobiia bacterium]